MTYLGDFNPGDVVDLKFTTVDATGAPTALTSGAISVYKDNSTTESTAGVTLTSPFDSRTGMHHVRITTASDGAFYSSGSSFQVVITTGTVGSTSVVGYIVGQFSLQHRNHLRPTTAGRTLDVSAGGEAGLDWANIGSPTTSQTLSGTTVGTVSALTANNDKTGYRLSAAGVDDVWDEAQSGHTTAGTFGKFLDVEVASRGTADPGDAMDLVADAVDSAALAASAVSEIQAGLATSAEVAAVQADTDDLQTRLPAALVGGRMDANLGAIDGSTAGVAGLDRSARALGRGTVDAGATTTVIPTSALDPAAVVADQFKGRVLIFTRDTTTSALRGQGSPITANSDTGVFTVTALTTAPASGDTFSIV